jgi:hypothetical protein
VVPELLLCFSVKPVCLLVKFRRSLTMLMACERMGVSQRKSSTPDIQYPMAIDKVWMSSVNVTCFGTICDVNVDLN